MTRIVAAALLALTLTAPALAADRPVQLTLDGRPVDRAGGIAVNHDGVVYADVIDLIKSFDGLLTFHGTAVDVTVKGTTGRFILGSNRATIMGVPVLLPGRVIRRNGDVYVPLDAFITRIAKAKVRTNAAKSRADIIVNANPMS